MPNPAGAISTYFQNLLLNIGRNSKGKEERGGIGGRKEKILTDFRKNILRSLMTQGRFLWAERKG